jgi:hypothetical protein
MHVSIQRDFAAFALSILFEKKDDTMRTFRMAAVCPRMAVSKAREGGVVQQYDRVLHCGKSP